MKCNNCGKEMSRGDNGITIKGIEVAVTIGSESRSRETINYSNLQLGKYSDGYGECQVAICLECYIDGLLHKWIVRPLRASAR